MLTLCAAVIAAAPYAVVLALLAWANRREHRRRDVQARQIALTDSVHERLGAVAAPVVRRRGRRWQVCVAVPFERPAVIQALLAIVRETFAPHDGDRRSLEIVLTRQPRRSATPAMGGRDVRKESLSWT
jgi:hypothetical protein